VYQHIPKSEIPNPKSPIAFIYLFIQSDFLNMISNFSPKRLRKALIWSSLILQSALATAQTTLISPTSDGGFENGASPASSGWTTVNASPDAWVVGAASTPSLGARGAYISNDNGTSWLYTLNATTTFSHIYKEVTVPAGENKITLSFKWKAGGEGTISSDNDNLKVFFGPSTLVSPSTTAGLATNYQLVSPTSTYGMYKLSGTTYNTETYSFAASPGTYRLVFTWKSNTSVLANPPAAIDEVSLVSSATPTITSTAMGGFWSSPQTWVGGVVPSGDDVVIAPNAIVQVDQTIVTRDLTISGQLQWANLVPRMVIGRDALVTSTGVWHAFGMQVVAGNTVIANTIFIGGNLTNNGVANFAAAASTTGLIFNGSMQNSRMAQTLDGTGTFIGTPTSGIIRNMFVQTTGSLTVSTTQNLIISGILNHSAGTLNTNGKLTLNNTAQVFGQPYNQQVCMIGMLGMGTGYTSQPTVTISAPPSGVTATAVANYDAASGTIRSITVTNPGSGYGISPTVTITGGGTPSVAATAFATVNNLISGNTVVTGQKSGGTTVTGGLNFATTPQSVGSMFVVNSATANIGYTSVPEVGFSLPGGMINYVTNGGSGYTSLPTVTVVGGTKVAGGTDPTGFLINVCQGKIVSITLPTAASGTGFTSLPTISITGGGGTGATAEFPAGCLATATAIVSNGMISDFNITNPGFGYGLAPSAMHAGGNPTAAAGLISCRIHAYSLTVGYYTPSTAPALYVEDAFVPPTRKISTLTISNYSGVQINGDLEIYGTSGQLAFSGGGGALRMGSTGTNTLSFPYSVYTGISSTLGYVVGSVRLAANGNAGTRTFPFYTPLLVNFGTGSLATGNTITSITATRTLLPAGATNTGAVTTGVFGYRVQTNAGSVFGTDPFVTMNYNADDGLGCTDNAQLLIAQSAANVGGTRTIRSVAAAAGAFTAASSRTTGITGAAAGPIVPTNDDYYSWATTVAPNVSIATGNWNAPATWSLGRVPDCTDYAIVSTGHIVTVNAASGSVKLAMINTGGTLLVSAGGTLTIGCTGFNNTLNIRGTLDVQGGTLNVNGNIDASNFSVFNQSGGNINVDGNDGGLAATSVASGVPIIQLRPSTFNSVNWTGGTLTIVDPHNSISTTQVLHVYGTSLLGTNVTAGHTLRLGDGVSTTTGGTTSGFSLFTGAYLAFLPLGNLVVEGPFASNRSVTALNTQGIRGNITVNNGGELAANTIILGGNLAVNAGGTYTSGSYYLYMSELTLSQAGGYSITPAMNAQSITNQGVMRSSASPIVNILALYINNSSATGVTLNSPITTNNLYLALGKVTTTTTNLLTLGTATSEGFLINGSATAYVDGPMARTFSARAAGALYDIPSFFPIGKGSSYMPVHLTPTTTTAGLQLRAEAFTANPSTFNNPLISLAPKRWEVTAITNGGFMTETGVRLNDAGITSGKEIVQSNSGIGSYAPISVASMNAGTTLTTAATIASGSFTGFLSYGERCVTPAIPTAAATQAQCSGKTVADLAATPASGATILWYSAAAGGSPLANATALATGNYYVAQTIGGGCESGRAAVAVTVNAVPTATIAASGVTSICQGQPLTLSANTGTGLTYQWLNNGSTIATATNATYTPMASGAYQVVVTNASNCSVTSAGINVTVYPAPSAVITSGATTVCQGQNVVLNATTGTGWTYQWQKDGSNLIGETNSNYTAMSSGSYTVVVTNTNNCNTTSVASVVTVNAVPTATISATSTQICQGGTLVLNANTGTGLTYQWQKEGAPIASATNSNYTATSVGSYTVIVTNASGCSQTSAVTTITVNPLSAGAATVTYVTPTSFCQGNNVVLNANTGASLRYTWQNNGVTIPNATASTYIATTSGVITVVVFDVNSSCTANSLPITVTVNPIPTPIISANANTAICQGDTVRLTASGGTSYSWSNGLTNATIGATAAGNYTVTVTSAANCSATTTQQVTVRALPTAAITAGSSTTFCLGGNVTLNANTGSGFTYQWQNNGASILGATNPSYMTNAAGSYRVIVTGGNGCVSTSTANAVVVNALPTPAFTPSGVIAICQGDSARVQIAGGTSYVWSDNSTGTSIWAKAAGPYMVTVTDGNGCVATASKSLTINALPMATITAGGVTSVCPDDVVSLSANTGTGLTYQWRRNAGNVTGATNRTFTAVTAGAYSVGVTDANGCKATSAETTVTIFSRPTVSFTSSVQAGTGSVMNFTNTSSAGTVRWYFGDALNSTSTVANPTFWYKANGTYSVRLVVTNANGCSDSTSTSIIVTSVRTGVNDLVEPLLIKVYPNPFAETVQIEIENANVTFSNNDKVLVTNALGQVVHQAVLNQKVMSLDTQDWSEGMYQVMIYTNGQMIPVKKVVKVTR
jgi:PKD repeat protein